MQSIPFTKMHGLGNDFIVINNLAADIALTAQLVRQMSDRHYGIGCDQILLIEKATDPTVDFNYRVFNEDGSEVSQCGNGVRCLAKYIYEQKLSSKIDLVLQSKSRKVVTQITADGLVTADFGVPVFEPSKIPLLINKSALHYQLKVDDGTKFAFGAVSLGNPHAVIVVADVANFPVEKYGPMIVQLPIFPEQVNVGFMEIVSPEQIKLRVFERGAGETLACGSGACAAVVIGRLWGLLTQQVVVKLLGGDLLIGWDGSTNNIMMTGSAHKVFVGEWCSDEEVII